MAVHWRDFGRTKLPPIDEGTPWLGGWMHALKLTSGVQLAVGDALRIIGRVPPDEFWQVLGILVTDLTKGGLYGQGWSVQVLDISLQGGSAPIASTATPTPEGAWGGTNTPRRARIWQRAWDGVTKLTWGDRSYDQPIIEPSNPVASVLGWPAGVEWSLESHDAETVGGAEWSFAVEFVVIRMLVKDRIRELRSPRGMMQSLLADAEMLNRAALLRG